MKEIGARIRARRIELGLSQTDLGKALNITFQQVQKYENGANRVPLQRLDDVAKVLQTTSTELFGLGDAVLTPIPKHPHARMILIINQKLRELEDPRLLDCISQIVGAIGNLPRQRRTPAKHA